MSIVDAAFSCPNCGGNRSVLKIEARRQEARVRRGLPADLRKIEQTRRYLAECDHLSGFNRRVKVGT